jgi:hypothetical protein
MTLSPKMVFACVSDLLGKDNLNAIKLILKNPVNLVKVEPKTFFRKPVKNTSFTY